MAPPQTPTKRVSSAPSTPTGSWRHPATQEIARRQAEHTFTSASVLRILVNSGLMIGSIFVVDAISSRFHLTSSTHKPPARLLIRLFFLFVWASRALFIYNVYHALRPLFSEPDDFSDIPLTPDQRKLFGLDPNVPPSPNVRPSDYVTPPRYQKSTPPTRSNSPLRLFPPAAGAAGNAGELASSTISTSSAGFGAGSLTAPSTLSGVSTSPLSLRSLPSSSSGIVTAQGTELFRGMGRAPMTAGAAGATSLSSSSSVVGRSPQKHLVEGADNPFAGNLNRWEYERKLMQGKMGRSRSPVKTGLFAAR